MVNGRDETAVKMHLSLNVRDVARSVAFYEAFFGAPPHKQRPGYANFDLATPPLKFALNEHPVTAGEGALSHLGFQVATAAQVWAAKERLQAAGLATFDEADTTCCYARQDKIWVHDPDGNAWEVYVITDDLQDNHDHDHAGRPLTTPGTPPSPALSIPVFSAGNERATPAEKCCPESSSPVLPPG
jgi:catechol 2,3-dioxygenase-like lactoylglutathione lyase family enzyme